MKDTARSVGPSSLSAAGTGIPRELYVSIEERLNVRKVLYACPDAATLEKMIRRIRFGGEGKERQTYRQLQIK